ncbi:UDP-glucose dehydrogenase family protein [Botrimarina hoheduenensis]|uniref:UDP-glucose 6-dehydrogenase n=1 Tax=Botrimarina hoheduenensis TaxID=2528000 RepID=A0A5C5W6Z5_9BACT|nr:UDP-glucose/GDP-mannose dehydrogenase family protein [Botrimarina hoheduenensis]TWT46666.1 UDP-glucose 6-dehydrogenase [Botrimarina hoheduenensis]
MKIAVIGTGYVGLVTGTCFANSGNDITCIDIDEKKITGLKNGVIPIYEPGLKELVLRNAEAGRLHFTTDTPTAVKTAEMVYLAVGTPQGDDGSADLSAMWAVTKAIAPHLQEDAIVVTKSTVPVGTNAKIFGMLKELTGRECHVASNPEFLKEGAAIDDFMKPDRVVVGVRCQEVSDKLHQLYAPFLRTEKPFLSMSPESAEMTKYVANALLATKISFINEMANLCEKMGGDINDVRRGIGHDSRIGFAFLFPGVGYGGSCFPKDVRALTAMTEDKGNLPEMLRAVDNVNERQKTVLFTKVKEQFGGDLGGKRIAVWGLAFKPETDDIREAPALVLIKQLQEAGATVIAHDPEAMDNVQAETSGVEFADRAIDAIKGADALCICTDWKAYHQPDFAEMYQLMAQPIVFDGRNLYDPERMKARGYCYHSIGRVAVDGRKA